MDLINIQPKNPALCNKIQKNELFLWKLFMKKS